MKPFTQTAAIIRSRAWGCRSEEVCNVYTLTLVKMTYRTALTISAEVEGQASGDRVESDPRGMLAALEHIWDLIDVARRAQEPRSDKITDDVPYDPPLPDDACIEVPFSNEDLAFVLARLEEGNAIELEILADEDLHPQTRYEQEESLKFGRSAVAEISRLIG